MTAPAEPTGERNPDAGNCFTVAWIGVEVAAEEGIPVRLVHGLPVGRGESNRGARFWHAWVEMRPGRRWLVGDYSNGQSVMIDRVDYYRAGNIDPHQHVWRYSWEEAQRQAEADEGRLGPWVPGWQGMGL